MKDIKEIVLTGGPCSGKTTALAFLQEKLSEWGYRVLIVPEAATMVITGGVSDIVALRDHNRPAYVRLQAALMGLQYDLRQRYLQLAMDLPEQKVVILHDRYISDALGYLEPAEFAAVVTEQRWTFEDIRDGVDAVMHLVTAADGAEEFYSLDNNAARYETAAQARAADQRLQAAWTGHPHLRVIDNSTDFQGKLHRLLANVARVLGQPVPLEIERKYLLAAPPDLADLHAVGVQIEQTYLRPTPDGQERRLRARSQNGQAVYCETVKRDLGGAKRAETERRITYAEYLSLLAEADPQRQAIVKVRHCFIWKSQYFELDYLTSPRELWLLEIELTEEQDTVQLPHFLSIDREVTEDRSYRMADIARL